MNYIQRNKKFLSVYLVWVFLHIYRLIDQSDYTYGFEVTDKESLVWALAPLFIYILYQSFKKPKK